MLNSRYYNYTSPGYLSNTLVTFPIVPFLMLHLFFFLATIFQSEMKKEVILINSP